jgi:hypothetical protein
MLSSMTSLGAGLLLAAVVTASSPQSGTTEARRQADLVTYNRLLTQVKQIDRDYTQTLNRAMRQARASGGQSDLSTLADLLALRDNRDRVMARLTMLGLRHGWDLPDSQSAFSTKEIKLKTASEQVFEPAEQIIKARFAEEAEQIAAAIKLPVIPDSRLQPSAGGAGR